MNNFKSVEEAGFRNGISAQYFEILKGVAGLQGFSEDKISFLKPECCSVQSVLESRKAEVVRLALAASANGYDIEEFLDNAATCEFDLDCQAPSTLLTDTRA